MTKDRNNIRCTFKKKKNLPIILMFLTVYRKICFEACVTVLSINHENYVFYKIKPTNI